MPTVREILDLGIFSNDRSFCSIIAVEFHRIGILSREAFPLFACMRCVLSWRKSFRLKAIEDRSLPPLHRPSLPLNIMEAIVQQQCKMSTGKRRNMLDKAKRLQRQEHYAKYVLPGLIVSMVFWDRIQTVLCFKNASIFIL